MATEAQAHQAREIHSDFLKDSGAHAISVDKMQRGGKNTFGVIAYFDKEPKGPVPDSLEIDSGDGSKTSVPLETAIGPRATLE